MSCHPNPPAQLNDPEECSTRIRMAFPPVLWLATLYPEPCPIMPLKTSTAEVRKHRDIFRWGLVWHLSSTGEAAPACCCSKYVFLGGRASAFLTSLLRLGLLLLGLLCGVPLFRCLLLTWLRPSQASSLSTAPRGFLHHPNTDEFLIFLCSPDFSLLNSKPKGPAVCSTFPHGCHTGIPKTCPSPTPDRLPQAWSPARGF